MINYPITLTLERNRNKSERRSKEPTEIKGNASLREKYFALINNTNLCFGSMDIAPVIVCGAGWYFDSGILIAQLWCERITVALFLFCLRLKGFGKKNRREIKGGCGCDGKEVRGEG